MARHRQRNPQEPDLAVLVYRNILDQARPNRYWFRMFIPVAKTFAVEALERVPPAEVRDLVARTVKAVIKIERTPKDVGRWISKNIAGLKAMEDVLNWPLREHHGSDENYFKVIDLTGKITLNKMETIVEVVQGAGEMVASFAHEIGAPKLEAVLYGEVRISGALQGHNALAWYYSDFDKVYVRDLGDRFVQSFIHELGHRFWRRFASRDFKREWVKFHHESTMRTLDSCVDAWYKSVERDEVYDVLKGLKPGDPFPYEVKGMKRGGPPIVTNVARAHDGEVVGWDVEHTYRGRTKPAGILFSDVVEARRKRFVNRCMEQVFPSLYATTEPEEHFCDTLSYSVTNDIPMDHPHVLRMVELLRRAV